MITRALSVAALALIAVAAQACAGTEESTASDEGAIHGADNSTAKPTRKIYAGRILYSEGQDIINPVGIVVELTCNGKSTQTKTVPATFVEKDGRVTTLDPKRFGNKFEFEMPESTAGCTIRVKDGTDAEGNAHCTEGRPAPATTTPIAGPPQLISWFRLANQVGATGPTSFRLPCVLWENPSGF